MKRAAFVSLVILVILAIFARPSELLRSGVVYIPRIFDFNHSSGVISPIITTQISHPLDRYTIDALTKRTGIPSQIVFDEAIATTSTYTVYTFHFTSDGKKATGLAHLPVKVDFVPDTGNEAIKPDQVLQKKHPVIVQLRGYVDPAIYTPGTGTKRSAEAFARAGFISLAPDFLGYGGSDDPEGDVFEERFQTYATVVDLLASIESLPGADASRVGIWAHSNGGQIALTALEITGKSYPTTLWAPVTKPFPYSILYYTDEADDYGKALRKKLAEFERNYDTDLYAMTSFVDRIAASIQLHQGTEDDAVPVRWNDEFVDAMKARKLDVEYYVYPGADHNMNPVWQAVIARDIEFFQRFFTEQGR